MSDISGVLNEVYQKFSNWLFSSPTAGCSSGSNDSKSESVAVTSAEFISAWEKFKGSICTDNNEFLGSVIKPLITTLHRELAKIVLEKKESFKQLNPEQQKEAIKQLENKIGSKLGEKKISDLMTWTEWVSHKAYCMTYNVSWSPTYGKPLPDKINLEITESDITFAIEEGAKVIVKPQPFNLPKPTDVKTEPQKATLVWKEWKPVSISGKCNINESENNINLPITPLEKENGSGIVLLNLTPNTEYTCTLKASFTKPDGSELISSDETTVTFRTPEEEKKVEEPEPVKPEPVKAKSVKAKPKQGNKPPVKKELPKCSEAYPPAMQPAMKAAGKCE
jgi:hypothetical protein